MRPLNRRNIRDHPNTVSYLFPMSFALYKFHPTLYVMYIIYVHSLYVPPIGLCRSYFKGTCIQGYTHVRVIMFMLTSSYTCRRIYIYVDIYPAITYISITIYYSKHCSLKLISLLMTVPPLLSHGV